MVTAGRDAGPAVRDVLASCLAAVLGRPNPLDLPRMRCAAVVLVDGLGAAALAARAGHARTFAARAAAEPPMVSGFPTTTAAALASLATATDPGTHGLVGYSALDPATGAVVNQLRGFSDRARSLAGAVPSRLHLPALPSPPGAMSAAQLKAIAQTVQAQRQSIAAMQGQLEAFDQQMAVFERILDPLVEWSSTWARLEEAVGDFVRRDGPSAG